MFERLSNWLRAGCLVFGALLLYQVGILLAGSNPLAGLKVPPAISALVDPADSQEAKGTASSGPPASLRHASSLPPNIQDRIKVITGSGLFGPVPRPLPMALLGIAGSEALIRTPHGQTGFLKEGATLGGVKLLRLGINRALIESEGKTQELTIFSGLGGKPLLTKEKETAP